MFKAKLSKDQKYILLELLKALSETDGNVSYEEMKMITNVMKTYKIQEYEYKNYTHMEIVKQLHDISETGKKNIITHATLLALCDGEFSEVEQDILKKYFDLLNLESISDIQKAIDKYGKLEYDMRNMFYEGYSEPDIQAQSVKMMYDFAEKSDVVLDEPSIFKMKKGQINKVWGKVLKLWNVVNDPKSDKAVKALAVGALIYLVSPIDVIPDFIPLAGLADDAGVITFAITQMAKMMKKNK